MKLLSSLLAWLISLGSQIAYFPRLFFLSGYRYLLHHLLFTFAIFVSIFILTIGLGFHRTVRHYFSSHFLENLPIHSLVVEARQKTRKKVPGLQLFGLATPKPEGLRYQDFQFLSRLPGVQVFGYINTLFMPVSIRAEFLGKGLKSDIVLQGISDSLLPRAMPFRHKEEFLPVLLPAYILNAYNSFARINQLPEFTTQDLLGFQLELILGKSSFIDDSSGMILRQKATIVGVTDIPQLQGLVAPESFVRKINQEFAGLESPYYQTIFARAKRNQDIPALTSALRQRGFLVRSSSEIAEKANAAIQAVTYVLVTLTSILLFFTGLSIFHGFYAVLEKKRYELMMFRVMGASRFWIILFVSIQVVVMALIYAWIGVRAADYSMNHLNQMLAHYFPQVKTYTSQLFDPPVQEYFRIIAAAPLFAFLVTLFPAIRLAFRPLHKDPGQL